MGWRLLHQYRVKLFTSVTEYLIEHPIKMDDEYARWWILGNRLSYIRRSGHYFLLQKDRRPFCYNVFCEVNETIAQQFPRLTIGVVFYRTTKKTIFNSIFQPSHVVCRSTDVSYIPTWKIDAVN